MSSITNCRQKLYLLIGRKYIGAALLAALFFWLSGCQTRHEQLHQLMRAGATNHVGYDTLLFTDSVFPIVSIRAGNQRQHWLIDTALPCLWAGAQVSDNHIRIPLINAAGDTLAESFGVMPPLHMGNGSFQGIGGGLLTDGLQTALQQKGIQGVIGANLMQHRTWHFDWENNRVIIAPSPEKFIGLPQTIALPFNRTIYRSPKWQVQFNRFPYQLVMQLSTGFWGGILLDAEFTANHTSFMYDNELQPMQLPYSIHGVTSGQGLVMDSLRMEGLHTFDDLPVIHSQSRYGLLGLAFLRRYLLTIDWRQRMIWLHAPQRGSIKSQRLP
ncbi:hypothetical protein [Rhodoflexus caldus]|uniref:hypothetical protein n=1 Tax=Rhodoflexus caldus TaxID=2891236 RepID=UPI00202A5C79|nr:hypothetical protein [Rhodoflexus caldus]